MAVKVKVKVDIRSAMRGLSDLQKKQAPYAAALAVNTVAFDVMRAERDATTKVFKHPRAFTRRGFLVTKKAKKGAAVAIVAARPEVAKYLEPYEDGGLRHLPGAGKALMNPVDIRLDSFGQIRGRLRQIGDKANVFVGEITFRKSGKTVAGIWQRPPAGDRSNGTKGTKGALAKVNSVLTGLKLLVRFTRVKAATKHFQFAERARLIAHRSFPAAFREALAKAMKQR